MVHSRLREYIELMNRHQLEELEVEENGFRVRLKKRGDVVKEVSTQTSPGAASSFDQPEEPLDEALIIRSPMVGTFYRAPNPEAESFVDEGDPAEEGSTLCIIEAMKVMNEVKAERKLTIEEILVQNGAPVEYGQPLFRVS